MIQVLVVVAVLVLSGFGDPTEQEVSVADAPRPNVVVIMTDDQSPIAERLSGYNEPHTFGPYGGQAFTPHIDKMAAEGIRFDRANVATTVCTSSRYNFLTGRYATRSLGPSFLQAYPPGTMSRPGNNVELDPPGTLPSLPQLLQAAGYRTGFVGKSHVIHHDKLGTPDDWESFGLRTYPPDADPYDPSVSAALAYNHAKWTQWMKPYGFDFVDGMYPANLKEQYLDAGYHHNLEWTVSKVLEFLEGSRDDDQPFFLYFATTQPHGPFPYKYRRKSGKYPHGLDGDIRITPEGISRDSYSFMPSRAKIRAQNAAAGLPERVAYMAWFDAGVGAILQKLRDIGADENTLVIVTSDHGLWRKGKGTLYDGGLRVPMITRWPASQQIGRSYDELISSIDLAPTLLDLAGIAPPANTIDGRSYRVVLEGSEAPVHDAIFAEMGWARAVKTKRWKYIAVRYPSAAEKEIPLGIKLDHGKDSQLVSRPYYSDNGSLGLKGAKHNPHYFESDQLFDLVADPAEEHNVIAEHPKVVADLRQRMEVWLRGFPNRPFGEFTEAR